MLTKIQIDEDALIDRAKQTYYARARREQKLGIYWDQLPESGWYYEQSKTGDHFVACMHGGDEAIRYRWTGQRMIQAS